MILKSYMKQLWRGGAVAGLFLACLLCLRRFQKTTIGFKEHRYTISIRLTTLAPKNRLRRPPKLPESNINLSFHLLISSLLQAAPGLKFSLNHLAPVCKGNYKPELDTAVCMDGCGQSLQCVANGYIMYVVLSLVRINCDFMSV